jgi:hypothetical protein
MARLDIEGEDLLIRVGWLERFLLRDRPQRVALRQIRDVDPHPRLPDMMLHWLGRHELWLSGVSAYEGQLIPSTRNPSRTLAIDLASEEGEGERLFVELDEDGTDAVAARIREAVARVNAQSQLDQALVEVGPQAPSAASDNVRDRLGIALITAGFVTLCVGLLSHLTDLAPSPLWLGLGAGCATAGVVAKLAFPDA